MAIRWPFYDAFNSTLVCSTEPISYLINVEFEIMNFKKAALYFVSLFLPPNLKIWHLNHHKQALSNLVIATVVALQRINDHLTTRRTLSQPYPIWVIQDDSPHPNCLLNSSFTKGHHLVKNYWVGHLIERKCVDWLIENFNFEILEVVRKEELVFIKWNEIHSSCFS